MSRTWFDTAPLASSWKIIRYEEVTLAHFAAIMGMTRHQYESLMRRYIREGRIMELVKFDSRCDLQNWIIGLGLHESGEPFSICIRISLNMPRDEMFFCRCAVHEEGDESLVKCDLLVKGLETASPREPFDKLPKFELMFCDLETDLARIPDA